MPDFRVGKPRCRVVRSTAQALAAGYNAISFDTVVYDDTSAFNGSTGIVVDRAGLYLIQSRGSRPATATQGQLAMGHTINGVRVQSGRASPLTTGSVGATWQDVLELDALDVVGLDFLAHGSLASTLEAGSGVLSVVRIGPVAWT